MTADEIFFAAMELQGAARDQFIAQACAANGGVRADVESLLAAHGRAGGFLRTPAVPASGAASSPYSADPAGDANAWIGRQIGAYRVQRVIGSGGMGIVLFAERADAQFEKFVAIKLIRAGLETEDVLRRFGNERQILAQLDHPNIARLIDGGVTDESRPYFVMDYVDGRPIDRYCEESRLSVIDRLQLFRKVCAAVQHAHQRLVVHRDLKPGNILITPDGEPRLLDFGIAKILDPSASGLASQTTMPAMRPFTPRYASPEQLRGQPVTTTSDVYSLGVILYELLTGLRPFDVQTDSIQELEHLVCAKEPTRPSTAVERSAQNGGSRRAAAADPRPPATGAPDANTRRLSRTLSGDLDNIVLMALRREPERRYASVAQLADDIRKYKEGHPVTARPDTLRYRASKFARRNAVAVGAAAVLFIGLMAAAATSMVLYLRADAATRESEIQRAAAEQINRFLEEMLASIDPAYARGRDVSVIRQVVDKAAERVDAELANLPEVAASLHLTLGNVYAAIALYAEAERHIRRSIDLRRAVPRDDRLEEARSLLAMARLLRDRSRYDEAEPLFRESIRIREKAFGPAHLDLADALVSFGVLLEHTGQYVEAEAAYRRALKIFEQLPKTDELALSAALSNLGLYLMYQNREPEAVDYFRRALAIRRAVYGDVHVSLIDPLVNLAGWHRRARRYQEAEKLCLEARAICRAHLEPDHPKMLNTLANLAGVYQDMGDYQTAEPVYRETLALHKRVNGELHKETATTTNNLASLLRITGKREEAIELFAQVARAYRQLLGHDHYWVSISLNNQGATLVELARLAEAEPVLREALRIRKLHNALDWQIAEVEIWLAACLLDPDACMEAEAMLLRGLAALQARDPKSRFVRSAFANLVSLYERCNQPDRAAEFRARLQAASLSD